MEHPKLAKIRGLLEKAASTEHEAERDALVAKAEELMARYRIDRAMLAAAKPAEERRKVEERMVDLGTGIYVMGRFQLLNVIGNRNEVKVLTSRSYSSRRAHLIGTSDDLDAVEFLFTSLLSQATTEMLRVTGYDKGHTKSMRRSFLFGFAGAIDGRLMERNLEAEAAAAAAEAPFAADESVDTEPKTSASVALVLADKRQRNDEFVQSKYGKVGTTRYAPAGGRGYTQGYDAGMKADMSDTAKVGGAKGALNA